MSDYATARQKMVDGQVRPSDVTDIRILQAMLAVPREAFVPPGLRPIAYLDLDIDIGGKRFLIKPALLAKLLQAAAIGATDKVLVVGSATGYSAAVVARLARTVVATEPDENLAANAKENLRQAGAPNVTVISAQPQQGAPDQGPFDVIIMEGATEIEPEGLYEQLKVGGRLAGVFAQNPPPKACLVTRSPGDFGVRVLFDASAPILPGLARKPAFAF